MPLTSPPLAARALSGCAAEPLGGRAIYRLWRQRGTDDTPRPTPWWFASTPPDDPPAGGRYDLPAPLGTCYTATSPVGAVLEALQAFLIALPVDELRARRMAHIVAPARAPTAADLTSPELAGVGVTAALWAGTDRPLTQRWAAAFRRDGWWALYGGLQHDPSGRLRGFALFDHLGAHAPSHAGEWDYTVTELIGDQVLLDEMARFGIVARERGELPVISPPPEP
ncbi:MAG: RES family NAD+ phosphorylase [Acidimicrobiales bacterium]